MVRGVQERVSANGEIEVVRDKSGTQFDAPQHDFFDEEKYLPLPTRRPNRESALIEHVEDEINIPSWFLFGEEGIEHPTFHPALKAAILAEGQEAMWVEDEASTVADFSVVDSASKVLKPSENVENNNKSNDNQSKVKKWNGKRWFGHKRSENATPKEQKFKENDQPGNNVQTKKKRIKKAVVLLPQLQQHDDNDGTRALVEANVAEEAAVNMVKARQLLHQALKSSGNPGSPGVAQLEASEQMAKVAFAHATAARRLMAVPEDGPDLDEILQTLSAQGEHAAHQHQRIVFSHSFEAESPTKTPKNEKFASKAFHYLESILPKNVDKGIEKAVCDDVWTEAGLSSLGFNTDTFEYKLDESPSKQISTNMELVSISSLNEILDGPEDGENKRPSPRQVLPVISIPRRQTMRKMSDTEKAADQAASNFDEDADNSENVAANGNGLSAGKKLKHKKKGISNMLSKSIDGDENSAAASTKSKTKWGVFGTILGIRQKNQNDRSEDTPPPVIVEAEDETANDHVLKNENEDTPEKEESVQSDPADREADEDAHPEAEAEENADPNANSSHDDDMLPTIQSKSFDSANEECPKNDRYGVGQLNPGTLGDKKTKQTALVTESTNENQLDSINDTLQTTEEEGELGMQNPAIRVCDIIPVGSYRKDAREYQDLYIQKGRSGEFSHNTKSLNTVQMDWDETVHLHPSQSRQMNTSNGKRDWDKSAGPMPREKIDPVVEKLKSVSISSEEQKESHRTEIYDKQIRADVPPESITVEKYQTSCRDEGRIDEYLQHQCDNAEQPRQPDPLTTIREPGSNSQTREQVRENPRYQTHGATESKIEPGGEIAKSHSLDGPDVLDPYSHPKIVDSIDKPMRVQTKQKKFEDDSLINFVISPGRIQLPHNENVRHNERKVPLSNNRHLSVVPETLVSKNSSTMEASMTSKDTKKTHLSLSSSNSKQENKKFKIKTRLSGIFGSKSKGKSPALRVNEKLPPTHNLNDGKEPTKPKVNEMYIRNVRDGREPTKSRVDEMPARHVHDGILPTKPCAFNAKDLEQAISDGNIKAFEANENAEEAPASRYLKKKGPDGSNRFLIESHPMKGRPVSPIAAKRDFSRSYSTSSSKEASEVKNLENPEASVVLAIRKGNSKAEETNIDTGDAPIVQHLKSLQRKNQEQRNYHFRDRTKRSSFPEGRKSGPASYERPRTLATAGRDPINDNGERYKSVPTPRRVDAEYSDNYLHQKVVTARLYGNEAPRTKSVPSHNKNRHASKNVYIGDLVDSSNSASSMEGSNDGNKEARKKPIDPSVCGDRHRVVKKKADPM